MADYIKSLARICQVSEYGGKAYHLSRLRRWGFSVPEGFCLSTRLLKQFILLNGLEGDFRCLQEALSHGELPLTNIESIRDTLQVGKFPPRFLKGLEKALQEEFSGKDVAVRSSAVLEDGGKYSFAGMLESELQIPAEIEPILVAIGKVWSSLFQDRVITYIIENRLDPVSLNMGVIIQRMVIADKGGVAFSLNPVNNDPEVIYVEETSAGADKVVGGSVRPEIHTVNKRMPPNLNSHMDWLMLLSRMVMKIESRFNRPVDVEWAWANDQLHILQARPITAIDPDKTTIWTDENVGEVLPEVVTPLTWSILGPMTNASFRWTLNYLGLHPPRKEKLFRLIHGKAYFNHSLFNGVLEKVFGGGFAPKKLIKRIHNLLLRRIFVLLRLAWMCLWLPFRSKIALRKNLPPINADEMKNMDDEIHKIIRVESELMRLHVANTFLGEVIYQILVRMVKRLKSGKETTAIGEWISGVGQTASAGSGVALRRVARKVHERFGNGTANLKNSSELSVLLESDQKSRVILEEFLSKHGHMSDQEFELRHPRWGEKPDSLYHILFNIISELGEAENSESSSGFPHQVIGSAHGSIKGRLILTPLLKLSRALNRNRENLKQAFIKQHFLLKRLIQTKSRLLCDSHFIPSEDSIYFLRLSEIDQTRILDPSKSAKDYHHLIRHREDEYRQQIALKHPVRWLERDAQFYSADIPDYPDADQLSGIPCSSGYAEGPVRVVSSFWEGAELRKGEILVVYSANPGWTPLFLLAKGIISEIGGALSHSAIIAREYGIPMVAAVKNVTSLLKTGDKVRINGTTGHVQLLNSKEVGDPLFHCQSDQFRRWFFK